MACELKPAIKDPTIMSDDHKRQQLGALDLGSNSFHLLVAQQSNGRIQVIDKHKEMVRLASGLTNGPMLLPEVSERALDCLGRLSERLRSVASENLRIVGTNTLRQVGMESHFVKQAEETLGHPIEIISGREEARLIYLGVCHSLGDNSKQQLVIDIGGGSTELIIGQNFQPKTLESLHMGCVSLSERHFPDGSVTAASMNRAIDNALIELEPVMQTYLSRGWEYVLGASGTINSIAGIQLAMGLGTAITGEHLETIKNRILKQGSTAGLPGLPIEREEVIAGGLAILIALFRAFKIEVMEPAQSALREGVIYDLLGRQRHEDVRNQTVVDLGRRFAIDEFHADRVRQTAFMLLAQVAAPWRLQQPHHRRLLGWACDLHEIGMDISHSSFHKHGGYLLSNLDMPGFSRSEQYQLAALVAVHRRKLNLTHLHIHQSWLLKLAVILRLACLMHRSRIAEMPPKIALRVDTETYPSHLTMALDRPWLDTHPLTHLDLEHEIALLGDAHITLDVKPA